jgi:hypothetical protein
LALLMFRYPPQHIVEARNSMRAPPKVNPPSWRRSPCAKRGSKDRQTVITERQT